MFKDSRIMIAAAHPDDEILGLGASINFLVNNFNALVHVVILGEGITGRSEKGDAKNWETELKIQEANTLSAKSAIGYQTLKMYDLPDNKFDTVPLLDIIKIIEKEKNMFLPDIIFVHHGGDLNIDHRLTFEAVMTAFRPLPEETVKFIFSYETPSVTEYRASSDPYRFNPNFYISFLKENLEAKVNAIECYEFERRKYPHPRSPEALEIAAKKYGLNIGKEYAEGFCLIRGIL